MEKLIQKLKLKNGSMEVIGYIVFLPAVIFMIVFLFVKVFGI